MMSLQQALDWLPSARLVGDGQIIPMRVHTDTRSLQAGDLFVRSRASISMPMNFCRKPRVRVRWRRLPKMV